MNRKMPSKIAPGETIEAYYRSPEWAERRFKILEYPVFQSQFINQSDIQQLQVWAEIPNKNWTQYLKAEAEARLPNKNLWDHLKES
jgi:hypothetical protein